MLEARLLTIHIFVKLGFLLARTDDDVTESTLRMNNEPVASGTSYRMGNKSEESQSKGCWLGSGRRSFRRDARVCSPKVSRGLRLWRLWTQLCIQQLEDGMLA